MRYSHESAAEISKIADLAEMEEACEPFVRATRRPNSL